ncbi:MAG: HlyC/CorC family transporter [Nitrospinae bacterium]|nr:HlyC/CorC family transporter [Nitrospinota bacterium]
METISYLALVFIFLVMEGFFSGSEIAIISASKVYIQQLANDKHPGAIIVEKVMQKPEKIFSVTSFGTNLSVVSSSAVLTALFIEIYGFVEYGDFLAALILVPLTLLLGEIVPKLYFQQSANKTVLFIIYPLKFFTKVFAPFIKLTTLLIKPFIGETIPDQGSSAFTREDLRTAFSVNDTEMSFEEEEREMIQNIISLHDTRVSEVMVPLVNITALELNSTDIRTVLNIGKKNSFSRIPIYKDQFYNIVGTVNRLELIHEKELGMPIKKFLKPVYYVPECKRIDDLLTEMQKAGIHTAIAVDEHGGSTGLITVEDILEEIVGEIEDEHDREITPFYEAKEDGSYIVEASVEIHILNKELNLDIPEGKYETLSGYILEHIQRIPERGDVITIESITFEVIDADVNKIYRIKLIIPETS